ncbi:MAG: hypothetical protein ACYDH5_14360 [Acidimicrobiales bacterium]
MRTLRAAMSLVACSASASLLAQARSLVSFQVLRSASLDQGTGTMVFAH